MTVLKRMRAWLVAKAMALPRFIRFLLTGGLNTMFGYGVFAACILLGINTAVSLAIAFVLGTAFNFVTYSRMVFSDVPRGFVGRFAILSCVLYAVNLGLLDLLMRLGPPPVAAQAILVLPMAVLGFFLNRLIVFPVIRRG
jgi:putative flippase GtrA